MTNFANYPDDSDETYRETGVNKHPDSVYNSDGSPDTRRARVSKFYHANPEDVDCNWATNEVAQEYLLDEEFNNHE